MRSFQILWLVPLLALTSAQKPGSPKSSKPPRQATSQSFGHNSNNNDGSYASQNNQNAYAPQPQYQPQQQQQAYKAYAPASHLDKPVHSQILQDNRQLNHDGTINFNYATDNGLQQGETVDPDGTRRGFYSYPGADGKLLTVKYTAGKNGFIAEGDHLPRQPQVPTHSDSDDQGIDNKGHDTGAYNPSYNSVRPQTHRPQPRPQYSPQPAAPVYPRHAGPTYSPQSNNGQYNHNQHHGHSGNGVQYSTGGRNPSSSGGFNGFQDFGPVNYGAPSHQHQGPQTHHASPQTQYSSHALPSHSNGGGGRSAAAARGHMFTANDPYQQAGPAGPYTGQFDLGNGGQFSIDFNPGQSQQVAAGGDFSASQSQQRY